MEEIGRPEDETKREERDDYLTQRADNKGTRPCFHISRMLVRTFRRQATLRVVSERPLRRGCGAFASRRRSHERECRYGATVSAFPE